MFKSLGNLIEIGPLNLPAAVIPLFVSFFVYQFIAKRVFRKNEAEFKAADTKLFNTVFILFAVWKLSPLVFQFDTVRKNLISILYLPGGVLGVLLAAGAGIIYLCLSIFFQKNNRAVFLRQLLLNALILAAVILVFLTVTALVMSAQEKQDEASLETVIEQALDLEMSAVDGETYKLSDYKGKVVIINFWASWCPPCRAEIPELISFYKETDSAEAVFLSVNMTSTEKSMDELNQFINAQQIFYPVLLDPSGTISDLFDVKSLPTTILLDRQGGIYSSKQGAVTEDSLGRLVKKAGE